MNLPIRVRLTAWYAVLLGAIILAIGAFLVLRLRGDLQDETTATCARRRRRSADGYAAEGTTSSSTSARRCCRSRLGRRRARSRPAASC